MKGFDGLEFSKWQFLTCQTIIFIRHCFINVDGAISEPILWAFRNMGLTLYNSIKHCFPCYPDSPTRRIGDQMRLSIMLSQICARNKGMTPHLEIIAQMYPKSQKWRRGSYWQGCQGEYSCIHSVFNQWIKLSIHSSIDVSYDNCLST